MSTVSDQTRAARGAAVAPVLPRAPIRRALRRFRRDEGGTATIEALLWIPMFFFLLIMIVNASFIFYGKSQALRIIQDGNRAYSTGRLATDLATEDYLRTRIGAFAPSVLADPALVDTSVTAGIITSVARIPLADMAALKGVSLFTSGTMTVQSQHFREF